MKATNTYKKIIAGSIIVGLALTLSACGGSGGGSKPPPPPPPKPSTTTLQVTQLHFQDSTTQAKK